jgi:phage gpG-like protein
MIRAVVVGQEGVIAGFQQVHPRVLGLVRRTVREETLNLVRGAKTKVSGAVLKTKTGTLRRGINAEFEETDTSIMGSAGIGKAVAKYPALHELGGTVTVREHTRRQTMVWGRPAKTIRQVTVRSHTATYQERSYLRSTLRENYQRIMKSLETAVAQGVKR